MSLIVLDPAAGYRRESLWLPKKFMKNLSGLKAALSFGVTGQAPISAWAETSTHLVVPRNFIPFSEWERLGHPMYDIAPAEFPHLEVYPRSSLKGPLQTLGFEAMTDNGDGVLSIPPGKGKTVVWLHAWAATKTPGIIIVHTQDLAWQWLDRIQEHTSITRDDIGWIQGDKWDWEKPITIASLQTLLSRLDSIPEELRRHFGVAGYDECHHLGGSEFNKTAGLFYGIRWGLGATEREDGLNHLFLYHIGPILFASTEHDVIPTAFFKKTGVRLPATDLPLVQDRAGDLNNSKLYAWLARNPERNRIIVELIEQCLAERRKILVLSESVEHVTTLQKQFPEAGLLTGESKEKGRERQQILHTHDLIFATLKLAQEGLDRKDLDTIILATPISSMGRLRQILGRIQREDVGKLPPILLILDDEKIDRCKSMCRKIRNHLVVLDYPHQDVA